MKREKIILSNLDIEILSYIKEEKFIKDISYNFDINYSMIKKHLGRLRNLKSFSEVKFGTFKKVKINEVGEDILKLLG